MDVRSRDNWEEGIRSRLMPKYKYKCKECFETFVMIQGMDESPITDCYLTVTGDIGGPEDVRCMGEVSRVPSRGGFSLKGKGWYKDGY